MVIIIDDDFDLEKIIESGQCFRPCLYNPDDMTYRFISGRYVLYIRRMGDCSYDISCSIKEFNKIWLSYFDLNTTYSEIRSEVDADDDFINKCIDASVGIRILRQDIWETLISFIISQRKSIPAIRSAVEKLCTLCGNSICTDREIVSLFPTPKQILSAPIEELAKCGLGYRLDYIIEAAKVCNENRTYLESLSLYDDTELYDSLIGFKGIGAKVANCIMLFGYHRLGRAPIDIWIQKVIDEEYAGHNPFIRYGEYAGVMQQYMFYYKRMTAKKV